MQLREDKTMESAIVFVGLVIGLCALSMFVTRVHGALWVLKPGWAEDRIFWILASGVVYSAMLIGAAIVLLVRPRWLVAAFGYTGSRKLIRVGRLQFWVCCVRAVGVASAVFGAAWIGHAVFWYRSTVPPAGFGEDTTEMRWEFVGAVFSFAFGGVLALFPQVVSGRFCDASDIHQSDADDLCDRRLLRDLIWSAALFALIFRLMWIARFATWTVEDGIRLGMAAELLVELMMCGACAWLMRECEWLANRLRPNNSYCQHCCLEQSDAQTCPECGGVMLADRIHAGTSQLREARWQAGWVRITALATMGWISAVAAARASIMVRSISLVGLSETLYWSLVNAAGAPVLFLTALFVFVRPRVMVQQSIEWTSTDVLPATGLRVAGLVVLGQSLYLAFFPISFLLRAWEGVGGTRFYPSGVVSTVQTVMALLLALYLFHRAKLLVRPSKTACELTA
jgi:hypothetical protein